MFPPTKTRLSTLSLGLTSNEVGVQRTSQSKTRRGEKRKRVGSLKVNATVLSSSPSSPSPCPPSNALQPSKASKSSALNFLFSFQPRNLAVLALPSDLPRSLLARSPLALSHRFLSFFSSNAHLLPLSLFFLFSLLSSPLAFSLVLAEIPP